MMWTACRPFKNATISRMLTVAHGTFCLVDIGDATIRGFVTGAGSFNPVEFFLRLNLVGIGRLTISLEGETRLEINNQKAKKEAEFAQKEKTILAYYIEGLHTLKDLYDDQEYLTFVDDLRQNEYITAFAKTSALAAKRGVPDSVILKTKEDIDKYFTHSK